MGTPIENARVRTGRFVEDEKGEAGNLKANNTPLATKVDRIAVAIPKLMTREAKRSAVREFLATWLQILRGEYAECGGR